ncbi:MAG: hypothetical protein HPY83_04105 [Anaerolineae bacterium]|nr:hypothetical protein [Anaerolineae bacterium]
MDASHKVELGFHPDRRSASDAADLAWQSYIRASQERAPVREAPAGEKGAALEDAAKRRPAGGGSAYVEFEVQADTGEVLVKVIDGETGRIVRTVPPEELMEAVRSGEDWARYWRIYV